MNTPQQEADELVEKMQIVHIVSFGKEGKGIPVSMYREQQIGCAIIAVEKLIKVTPSVNGRPPNYQEINEYCCEFWEEVLTILRRRQ